MTALSSPTVEEALAATAAAGTGDATPRGRPTNEISATHDTVLAATGAATHDTLLVATAMASMSAAPPSGGVASTELARGALVGRYVVLSKLGAGGMGVVFAAYDPELDRKVALKLLHPRLGAGADAFTARDARTRLVREAQALARLNHPHIVAIHDVGEHERRVWLAMEYVAGETLSAWMDQRRRTWREVLDIMTPTARGLSAAHEAGLVHRDIKPDNIMVGSDGRVRVMDLGLARALGDDAPTPVVPDAPMTAGLAAQVTRAGAVLGTPAYMSPEQFRGEPVDARADVYSFCVTLWEALMGERPFAGSTLHELTTNVLAGTVPSVPRDPHARRVPGWLRHVCLQGLAVEPGRRFPSMKALLEALSDGRARARTRKWLVGVAAVATLGGSAALYQRHERAERIATCEEAGAGIFDVWNDEAQTDVRAGIVATGLSYAPVTAEKIMPVLDAQAEAWRAHRTRACLMADVEGTLDAELRERAVWCLDERRMEFAALVTELSRADAKVVQKAVTAAAGLRPASPCTDRQVLAALPSPPPADTFARANVVRTRLSQARAHLAAGKYPEGLALTRTAIVDAQALGWTPLTAAAQQLEGTLLERTGAYAEAEAASLAAYMEAAKMRAWDVAASAAVDLEGNVGYRQARHAEGKVWSGHAEVAVLFAGDPLDLRAALRDNNLGLVHQATGAYAEATALYERALAIREKALGSEHPDVAASLNNLAHVHWIMGAYAEAKVLLERALAIREKALGPEHPDVADALNNLAAVFDIMGAYTEAKALYERALVIREKALGPDHPDVAASLNNLAAVHYATGANVEAKALWEQALAIWEKALGPEHPTVAMAVNNLAAVHDVMGEYAAAKVLYERALASQEKVLGPEHPDVARSLNNLAHAHHATGADAEANALYKRALAIREKALGPEHPTVALSLEGLGGIALARDQPAEAVALLERAVAIYDQHEGVQDGELDARFNLARALVRSNGDRTHALAEARKAADGFRKAGEGKAKDLAEVGAFLATHGDGP